MRKAAVRAWVLAGSVALVGCGGGGGGSGATATPTHTPTVEQQATPTSIPTATATLISTLVPVPTETAGAATPTPTVDVLATAVPSSTSTEAPQATATPVPPSATATTGVAATATPTLVQGPVVSAIGLADTNGTFDVPTGQDAQGRAIFGRQVTAGFILFVEGRPGRSGLPVALNLLSSVPGSVAGRPDLQVLLSRPLGDGSPTVCDTAFPNDGGVPAVEPPTFAAEQSVSDAINDMSCRFRTFTEPSFACTQDSGNSFRFASPASTVQFCTLVNDSIPFPRGDTVLTVRLRDTAGNLGEPVQIVVRISG